MDDTLLFAHSITQDARVQRRPKPPASDASVLSAGNLDEKALMRGLNERLAGFIEKVHRLERHNHLLETEIAAIRGKAKPAALLQEEYGPELRRLRQLVQDISHQKHHIETEHRTLEEELSDLRRRHEREAQGRSDADSGILVLKRDISDAYRAKVLLDKKAQALVDEIHLLKRNHEAEVSEVCGRIQDAQVTDVETHEFGDPGVTAALRDIRAQLEGRTVADVGETFRSQFVRLTEAAESKREALKATQQLIQEQQRRLQAKSIELDCTKGVREALEKQLHDAEDRHKEEIFHYQNTIKELENELMNCKFDMSGYLGEYQDLFNVKMALDVEILSYRKLLCSEESRMSGGHVSLPYIYHQSPVYTLPRLSRPGGAHRRAEPQYKFVEEIITETTREIEMSEFEETGSEETEVEKDEQQWTKGRESEQVSDSEKTPASGGNFVNGGDGGTAGGKDNVEKGQTCKEKSEETAVDGGMDENIQNQVLESERFNEEKVADDEKEAADQRELVSKPEDEPLKSDDGKKDAADEQRARARQGSREDRREKEHSVQ